MMRQFRFLLIFFTMLLISLTATTRAQVNGERFIVDGTTVVHIWGSHSEMGYAHGYLLSGDIMKIIREYMFTVISPDTYENYALPAFRIWMSIPDEFQQELDGMLQGIQDGGSSIYVEELERDLTAEDLAVMNSIVDFWVFVKKNPGFELACSSTCGWGDGTSEDTETPGGTLHCRDMDWTDTSNYILGKSTMIIAYESTEANEQNWISISYPGYIGCLSGMNENGTGATLNLGNNVVTPGATSGNVPICLQVRTAIEGDDPNGDGSHNSEDVWDTLNGQDRIPSTIVHTFGKAQGVEALDPPALVVESNHSGIARRNPSDEPDLNPFFIAATNHHRKLYTPVSCWRYDLIVDDITDDYRVDTAEIWQIETDVSVSTTMHTMLFRPDLMDMYLAVSTDATPAPYHYKSYLEWDQMFTSPGTPTITPTPTETPDQTATPTPQIETPTATPHSFKDFIYDLQINQEEFTGSDPFILSRNLEIPESVTDTMECVILDVAQNYWFWPGWTREFDGHVADFEPGLYHSTILEFIWPENVEGTTSGILFWAALLTEGNLDLLTNVDLVEFGYY